MSELSIKAALQAAIVAHKAGQLQEAERLYGSILKIQPNHSNANHNVGILAVGLGKVKEALPFFKTALEADPHAPQFWLSYIDAMIKVGRFENAKALLGQAESYGVKGDDFDKFEQILHLSNAATNKADVLVSAQSSSQETFKQLLILHNEGKSDIVFPQAQLLTEQYPEDMSFWHLLGAAASQIGKLDQAILAWQKVLSLKPDDADTYSNIGTILQQQGKFIEGMKAFSKALSLNPDHYYANNNMGNAFHMQGEFDNAIEAYSKALSLSPNNASIYLNIGNALQDKGKASEAIEAYSKALSIKSDYAEAFGNMGAALYKLGNISDAIKAYSKALDLKSDYPQAYVNLGLALKDQGKTGKAIDAYATAISLKTDYVEAYSCLGDALRGIGFTRANPDLQVIINSMLKGKIYVVPKMISASVISLLKFETSVVELFKKHSADEIGQSLQTVIAGLSGVPLLLTLMSVCPINDLKLEACLTDIRAHLLLSVSQPLTFSEVLLFQSALALQCFTNEYIYAQTDIETNALRSLEIAVKKMLSNGEQPSPQAILCLASYKALHEYEWSKMVSVTNAIADVVTRQVLEPKKEAILKSDIPVLAEISDEVSSKVRDQYEDNPYPRWVNLRLNNNPVPISEIAHAMELKLFDHTVLEVGSPDILIAGCGTGQHSIAVATRFKGSQVLAIDLSLSSLAYAKRKGDELGIKNIEYMQADILDLGNLDRKFDVVESAGVLHHMDDPIAGWRVLVGCLKTGGLMKIGLYSELARQDVVKIREELYQAGIGPSNPEMKSFRSGIINSDKGHYKRIASSGDFFCMSALRDLLFHVQEHRFTIPQIQDYLNQLGLNFCGFESPEIVQEFKLTNTDKADPYDLAKWNIYEQANPFRFGSMYQFWCQKIS